MRRPFLYLLLLLLLAMAATLLRFPARGAESGRLPSAPLVIETPTAAHRFTVELADTPATRERGLMFRRAMAAEAGMLFDFQQSQPVAFWMKNTYLPLDMIFIADDGKIAAIARRTVPLSEATVPSPVPVRAVLEINAGVADRLRINPGDQVRHPIFGDWR
ncbi:MAG: DUF192 domain-containing protein [Alphaproteobacteria bacterium]|nr:DUF192 domain-containing protein [Alphaproteobacteria bacterium]